MILYGSTLTSAPAIGVQTTVSTSPANSTLSKFGFFPPSSISTRSSATINIFRSSKLATLGEMGAKNSRVAPAAAAVGKVKQRRRRSEDEDDFVPTAEFNPVIPLPPLVEVRKGDEDENLIVEIRCKLYRFESTRKEWKERGTGNIKILRRKDDLAKVRVVMWPEHVQKVACNHHILPGMTISPHRNSAKALTWGAVDFSEDCEIQRVFVAKFGNEKQCEEFKKHFQDMIDLVDLALAAEGVCSPEVKGQGQNFKPTPASVLPPISSVYKKAEGSWDCDVCYVNNKSEVIKCAACGTMKIAAEKNSAEVKVKVPEEARPCAGCIGCDSDNFDFSVLNSRVLPTYPQQTLTPEELVAYYSL